jgi:competence protein ComEC
VLQPLLAFLQGLAAHPDAIWSVPQAGWAAAALAVAGGLLAVLPLPWRLRWLGLPLALPLLWPVVPHPAEGEFELLAADVGQGSAVLVRTAHHLLVHDTGPRWAEDGDAGRRTLLPLLQALGEQQVDELVLSHSDLDHVGGAASLLAGIRVVRLRSSLVPGHPLLASAPTPAPVTCAAGQQWQWDGVNFTVLHPAPGAVRAGVKPNTLSCVLRVQDSAGHSALLTGDIEAEQEAALAHQLGPQLRSSVLVVPHHGSRTSSTDAFLAAVQPTQAVIQVGYRSRFGHPHPEVWARYQALGIKVVRTDFCGAWTWRAAAAHCAREAPRRYWQWQIDLNEPEGGVVVATVGSAGEHE